MTTGINDEMKQAIQEGVRAYLTELTRGSITDELRGIVTGHVRNFDYRAAVGDLSGSLKATIEETVKKELAQRLMKARPRLILPHEAHDFVAHECKDGATRLSGYRFLKEFSVTDSLQYNPGSSSWPTSYRSDAEKKLEQSMCDQALDAAAIMGAKALVVRKTDIVRIFSVGLFRNEMHGVLDAAAYALP